MDKDTLISFIGGELTSITVGAVSIGKAKLISIILYGTLFDYGVLCFKTLALGIIGGIGSLVAKELWERIKARF